MQMQVHTPGPVTLQVTLYGISSRVIESTMYNLYHTNKGIFLEFWPGRFIRLHNLKLVSQTVED